VKKLRQTKDPKEQQELLKDPPKWKTASEKLLELAEKNPKDAGVCPKALVRVLIGGGYDQDPDAFKKKEKALDLLQKNHLESDQLGDVCSALVYSYLPNAEKFLRAVMEKNPAKNVQARACFSLAQIVKAKGENLANSKPQEAKEINREVEKLFETVVKKYGDVVLYTNPRTKKDVTLGSYAEGELFEIRELVVGKTAPDIEGEDIDGKKMKLSDYRGKVVLLDFWGHW
jgi:hypothetical protein